MGKKRSKTRMTTSQKRKKDKDEDGTPDKKKRKIQCYNCEGWGHVANQCPSERNKKSSKYPLLLLSLGIIVVNCTVNGRRTRVIVDSGCKQVLISKQFWERTRDKNTRLDKSDLRLTGAGDEDMTVLGYTTTTWDTNHIYPNMDSDTELGNNYKEIVAYASDSAQEINNPIMKIGKDKYRVDTAVIGNLMVDVILGTSAFKDFGIIINGVDETLTICGKTLSLNKNIYSYDDVIIYPGAKKKIVGTTDFKTRGRIVIRDNLKIPKTFVKEDCTKVKAGRCNLIIHNVSKCPIRIPKGEIVANFTEISGKDKLNIETKGNWERWENITNEITEDFSMKNIIVNGNLKKDVTRKLVKYLVENKSIFREKLRKGDAYIGEAAKITIKKGIAPKQARIYPRPPKDHDIIEEMMKEFQESEIVEKCEKDSDWRGHAVLQKKKDGKTRFTCDFRHMGPETCEKYPHPLPLITEILDNLKGAKFFTKIDFTDGYFHVMIKGKYRKYFAFATRSGVYQWCRLPQGWMNSGAIFQNRVDRALGDLKWKCCMPYIDDIIIFSKTEEEHMKHIEEVFSRLAKVGFHLKLRKCEFFKEEIEFLGHVINRDGIKPNPEKVKAISEMPPPKTKSNVKSFLGLASYYRRFIKDFAKRTYHIRNLTKEDSRMIWSNDCQKEFEDIKMELMSDRVMAHPDWNKPFILATDASKQGLGAVLSQIVDGKERPIAYASRGCTDAEQNYGISQLEGLGVVWGIDKFRAYLTCQKFTLITDHRALTKLREVQDNNPMLYRWSLKLAGYDYNVQYKKGSEHGNADGPSRNPVLVMIERGNESLLGKLKRTQLEDEWCNALIGKVLRKGRKLYKARDPETLVETELKTNDFESWVVINDTLWHRLYKKGGKITRRYIPQEMRRDILESAHNRAHLGYKKTYANIQERFFWRNMSRDCHTYCSSCDLCQRRYTPSRKGIKLGRIYATKRNELVGMDIFSGLPESNSGYKHILVMTDYVTKYVVAVPMITKNAEEVAEEFIDKWCMVHSWPERIQTDQGGEFTANLIKAITEAVKIRRSNTTPYHPQANGQVERFNRTMAQMLSKKCYRNQRIWDTILQEIVYEYNCSKHRVTGQSPFYLTFGRKPKLELDILLRIEQDEINFGKRNAKWKGFMKRISEVNKSIEKSWKFNAKAYDASIRKEKVFKKGELVLTWKMPRTNKKAGEHKKLKLPGKGPYKIAEVFKDTNTLKLKIGKDNFKTVNLKNVRKFTIRPEWMKEPDEEEVSEMSIEDLPEDSRSEEDEHGGEDPWTQEQIEEIFDDNTQNMVITPGTADDALGIGVDVEVFRNGQWIPGTIQRIRKEKKKLRVRVVGPRINAWHTMNSKLIRRSTQ